MTTNAWRVPLVLAIISILLSGCIFQGTGTGNPMTIPLSGTSPAPPGGPTGGYTTAADLIAGQLCFMAVRCHEDWIASSCLEAIYPLRGFAARLGVTMEPEPTLTEIKALETRRQLEADGTALRECLDDLRNLDCAGAKPDDTPAILAGWLSERCEKVERSRAP